MKKNTKDREENGTPGEAAVGTSEQTADPGKRESYREKELREISNASAQEIQHDKTSHKKWSCLVVVGILLLLTYCIPVLYFRNRFYGATYINGESYGFCSAKESEQRLIHFAEEYELRVTGRGDMTASIRGSDTGLRVVPDTDIRQMIREQNPFLWFVEIFKEHHYTIDCDVEYDEAWLAKLVDGMIFFDQKLQVKPENAYISGYIPEKKRYEIVPEVMGTQLLPKARERIMEAYRNLEDELDLDQEGLYRNPRIFSDDGNLTEALANRNRLVGSSITLTFGENRECVDGELIHTWMRIAGTKADIEMEQLASYVKDLARKYNTYGKKRTFLTIDGLELTLKGGAFGWRIDQEAEAELLYSQILEGIQEEREPVYSDRGVEYGERNDIGQTYIEINLSKQHLYVFVEGEIVLESDFVSGDVLTGCTTPPGVFAIRGKTTEATLRGTAPNGDSWVTPVHYWMPFNGGIGFHDATWRRQFGGEIYLTNGSHGCINLPRSKAEKIYEIVYKGMPVICYYEGEIPQAPGPVTDENGEGMNE